MFGFLAPIAGALFGSGAATAATISTVGSLAGGMMSRRENRRAVADQNEYNHPVNIRARAEEAGFNPLQFIGPGVGQQTALVPGSMGQAIADSAMSTAQFISEDDRLKQQLQAERDRAKTLNKRLEQKTVRPTVGGIFGQGGDKQIDTLDNLTNRLNSWLPTPRFRPSSIVDERPYVEVLNPASNKYVSIHPGVAERLDLKNGDVFIAEDGEAIYGDGADLIINAPNMVNEAIGAGAIHSDNRPIPGMPKLGSPERPPSSTGLRLYFDQSRERARAARDAYEREREGAK